MGLGPLPLLGLISALHCRREYRDAAGRNLFPRHLRVASSPSKSRRYGRRPQCLTTPPNRPRRPLAKHPRTAAGSVPESTFQPLAGAAEGGRRRRRDALPEAPEGIRAWAERRYSGLISRGARRRGHRPRPRSASPPRARRAEAASPGPGPEPQLHLRSLRHRPGQPRSPTAPRWPSPRRPRRPTTRSSSTALPGSARPTCWRRSPTTSTTTPPGSASATRPPSRSPTSSSRRCASTGAEAFKAPLPRHRRAADRRRPVPRGQARHRGGVLPHLQRPLRGGQPAGPLRRPDPERALDPRLAPARPLRVGPDRRRRAAQPGDPAHRPAPPGRGGRDRDRRQRRPHRARQPHRRQRPPAARRPDPRDRPRLAARQAAQLRADRRGHPALHAQRPGRPRSRRSSSRSPNASASPAPS